jgi:hypothetical protein
VTPPDLDQLVNGGVDEVIWRLHAILVWNANRRSPQIMIGVVDGQNEEGQLGDSHGSHRGLVGRNGFPSSEHRYAVSRVETCEIGERERTER